MSLLINDLNSSGLRINVNPIQIRLSMFPNELIEQRKRQLQSYTTSINCVESFEVQRSN